MKLSVLELKYTEIIIINDMLYNRIQNNNIIFGISTYTSIICSHGHNTLGWSKTQVDFTFSHGHVRHLIKCNYSRHYDGFFTFPFIYTISCSISCKWSNKCMIYITCRFQTHIASYRAQTRRALDQQHQSNESAVDCSAVHSAPHVNYESTLTLDQAVADSQTSAVVNLPTHAELPLVFTWTTLPSSEAMALTPYKFVYYNRHYYFQTFGKYQRFVKK